MHVKEQQVHGCLRRGCEVFGGLLLLSMPYSEPCTDAVPFNVGRPQAGCCHALLLHIIMCC